MEQPHVIRTEKRGVPAVWECGGGWSNTGEARIVCKSNGERKIPLYTKTKGNLACAEHALFAIHAGDLVIDRKYGHGEDFIAVWECTDPEEDHFTLLYSWSQGEWDKEFPDSLNDAIQAAWDKASDYHCRTAYYAAKKEVSE